MRYNAKPVNCQMKASATRRQTHHQAKHQDRLQDDRDDLPAVPAAGLVFG